MRKKLWFDSWARKSPITLIWFLSLCMVLLFVVFSPLESIYRAGQEVCRACRNWSWYWVLKPFYGLPAQLRHIRENVRAIKEGD